MHGKERQKRNFMIVIGFLLMTISISLVGRIEAEAYPTWKYPDYLIWGIDEAQLQSDYRRLPRPISKLTASEQKKYGVFSGGDGDRISLPLKTVRVKVGEEAQFAVSCGEDVIMELVVDRRSPARMFTRTEMALYPTDSGYIEEPSGRVEIHIVGLKPGKVKLNVVTGHYYQHKCTVEVYTDESDEKALKKTIKDSEKNNWHFKLASGKNSDSIVLTEYIGKSKDAVVPKKIGKYKVLLNNGEHIQADPFAGNTKIRSVSFEKGFKSKYLPCDFCSGCVNLKKVTLPEGLVLIEDGAFKNCTSLKSITLPKTVKGILYASDGPGEWNPPFAGSGIKEIKVKTGNKYLFVKDGVLYSRTEKSALIQAPALKKSSIKIPKGIKTVDAMFLNSYVKKVSAPSYCRVSNTGKRKTNKQTGKIITGNKVKVVRYKTG